MCVTDVGRWMAVCIQHIGQSTSQMWLSGSICSDHLLDCCGGLAVCGLICG